MLASVILITFNISFAVVGLFRKILLQEQLNAVSLVGTSIMLFVSTVLVFTVWYWILDSPSQEKRVTGEKVAPVLIFPQNNASYVGYENWTPEFIDYLYFSSNTSTAFGPTDTYMLSRPGKVVAMLQVLISVVVIIALAAWAIGMLH